MPEPTFPMLAPGPFKSYSTQQGNTYTSDVNSIIAAANSEDIVDLTNSGCIILPGAALGKNNTAGTTAPTASADSTQGYGVGSFWLDVTNKNMYRCLDATATAAVWEVSLTPGVVNATGTTLALTSAQHAGKTVTVNRAAGTAITLPAATGTGDIYSLVIGTTVTSNTTTVTCAGTDYLTGSVVAPDTDAAGTGKFWSATGTNDTITLDGTARGGKAGDTITLVDTAAGVWVVSGCLKQSGGSEATPFSGS